MQTIFCTECGSKVVYSGAKPKFCSSCGHPIGGSGKSQEQTQNVQAKMPSIREQVQAKKNLQEIKDDETDIDYVPNISSFDYEINSAGNPVFKFEDLINVSEEEKTAKPRRVQSKPRKKSK